MASRRLDISSLLCDTNEPPKPPEPKPIFSQPQQHSPVQNAYPQIINSPRDRSLMGLDALVHAATEVQERERRRLSGSSAGGESEQARHSPVDDRSNSHHFVEHRIIEPHWTPEQHRTADQRRTTSRALQSVDYRTSEQRQPELPQEQRQGEQRIAEHRTVEQRQIEQRQIEQRQIEQRQIEQRQIEQRQAAEQQQYARRIHTSLLSEPIYTHPNSPIYLPRPPLSLPSVAPVEQYRHQTHSPVLQLHPRDTNPPPPKKQRRHSDNNDSLHNEGSNGFEPEQRLSHKIDVHSSTPTAAMIMSAAAPLRRPGSGEQLKRHPVVTPEERISEKSQIISKSKLRDSERKPSPLSPPSGVTRESTPAEQRKKKPPAQKRSSRPAHGKKEDDQEDPHEWFLEHFAESLESAAESSTSKVKAKSQSPTAPAPPAVRTASPRAQLDEEKADSEMDVDLAVTQLVEETLGSEKNKIIQVDVEDELLSLIEDLPPAKETPPERFFSPPASGLRPSSLRYTSTPLDNDRKSMPPPAAKLVKKKKETSATKAPPKPKASAKPRVKPAPKGKGKAPAASFPTENIILGGTFTRPAKSSPTPSTPSLSASGRKTGPNVASRSRSTSVLPGASDAKNCSDNDEDENKPYCVCKTQYDEDRVMIACDRCDEWYHTQCVNIPDLEVDLVDQFICPICVNKEPTLDLRTTYKVRCLRGLSHPDPSSTKACHKPSRGAFSKYCSHECGVKHAQFKIDAFTKKGGKKEKLWELVKNAEPREGVIVRAEIPIPGSTEESTPTVDIRLKRTKIEREVERLTTLLDETVRVRENLKQKMDVTIWREKLLELASERAEALGHCGWDQRLCFDDEKYAEEGPNALRSYDDSTNGEQMAVDGETEWWCKEDQDCERHADWHSLRLNDINKEMEQQNESLSKLTSREREIRKKIEDIIDPTSRVNDTTSKRPLKPNNNRLGNGYTSARTNGTNESNVKRGKKRKAPT